MTGISDFIVIGSSRGLGAALVQELLDNSQCHVTGISRTSSEQIANGKAWISTGRYDHLQLDIAAEDAAERMAGITPRGTGRVCVVFNAAHIEKDYTKAGQLDYAAFDRVNRVGIAGLRSTIVAFERTLLDRGGLFAGVSSFWGRFTPVSLPYVAYPATKAYLDSTLKSLRALWPSRITVTSVTIGNIKDASGSLPSWFIPTYRMAARVIVRRLTGAKLHSALEYPCWHAAVYKYALKCIPGRILPLIFGAYLKMEAQSGIPPHKANRSDR
jgi:NAD(P)-dependent dehydrogenase (short-subunit alcohol dehydrogenase family)